MFIEKHELLDERIRFMVFVELTNEAVEMRTWPCRHPSTSLQNVREAQQLSKRICDLRYMTFVINQPLWFLITHILATEKSSSSFLFRSASRLFSATSLPRNACSLSAASHRLNAREIVRLEESKISASSPSPPACASLGINAYSWISCDLLEELFRWWSHNVIVKACETISWL